MKKLFVILLSLLTLGLTPALAQHTYVNIAGTTYFDTGYEPTVNTKMVAVMRIARSNVGWRAVFGTRQFAVELEGNKFRSWINTDGGTTFGPEIYNSTPATTYQITLSKDGTTVKARRPAEGEFTLFGAATNATNQALSFAESIYIGAVHNNDKNNVVWESRYCNGDVEEFTIYENDKLVRHYIAAQKDGQAVMLETRTLSVLRPIGNDASISHDGGTCVHKYAYMEKDTEKNTSQMVCYQCGQSLSVTEWAKLRDKEDNDVASTEAYINTDTDKEHIGWESVTLTSMDEIQSAIVFDANNNYLYEVSNIQSSSATIPLPQSDSLRHYTVITCLKHTNSTSTEGDYEMVYQPCLVEAKPFHAIAGFEVTELDNTDKTGLRAPKTRIRVAIDNPQDEDLMDADNIVIQRSSTPDFTQYSQIDNVSIDANSFKQIETLEDGTKRGWYEYIDEDADATLGRGNEKTTFCSRQSIIDQATNLDATSKELLRDFYTGYSRPVYYRVVRATAQSLWNDIDSTNFQKVDSTNTLSMLPKVTEVAIMKDEATWEKTKRVKVNISMDNPYPWEYNTQLKEADVRKALGDDVARRYVWNENASIRVERYTTDQGQRQAYAKKEFTIKGEDVTWNADMHLWTAVIEDQLSFPNIMYYYKAIVDTTDCEVPPCVSNDYYHSSDKDAENCYSTAAALINEFTATRGTNQENCHLQWDVATGSQDKIALMRRDYKRDGSGEWTTLATDLTEKAYTDTEALPGHIYEYRLMASTYYLDQQLVSDSTLLGWRSYYGTLEGKVVMPDGTGLAHAKITITRQTPVDIDDVYDADGHLILKGVHEGLIANAPAEGKTDAVIDTLNVYFSETLYTDENGYFKADDVINVAEGATYGIKAEYPQCTFTFNGQQGDAQLTLSKMQSTYDMEFVCNSAVRYTGRILYAKSTVPVPEVRFRMTVAGTTTELHDNHGTPITTDNKGNFSFYVPTSQMRLQAYKDGHTIDNNGFFIVDKEDFFQPKKDLYFTIGDLTKIRLRGRIRGGEIQNDKPVGFAQSTNNLGDNLTMVLMLEGDNTSQIVFDEDIPDNTINATVLHEALRQDTASASGWTTYPTGETTKVTYEKKRIVIVADPRTGEFCADVFPAKYKVTQLSAQGYGTLYSQGEGFEILDLTNDTTLHTTEATLSEGQGQTTKTFQAMTQYHSLYKRVYHNPVSITMQQYTMGQLVDYFGEQKIKFNSLTGERITTQAALVDKATRTATYVFDHPIYEMDKKYIMYVRAHEDYYYNNDTRQKVEQIYINHGQLKVLNGLVQAATEKTYDIDANGSSWFDFTPSNTNFSQTGDDALRQLNVSVLLDGFSYEAEPHKAFVMGYKSEGSSCISNVESDITLLDVLRDPPGANSTASLSKGTTYSWSRNLSWDVGVNLNVTIKTATGASQYTGAFVGAGGGATGPVTGTVIATDQSTYKESATQFTVPVLNFTGTKKASYTMTTDQTITTSSDPKFTGSMSDVYLGTVNTTALFAVSTISVIDTLTYRLCKNSLTLIKEGTDDKGVPFYLVISDKLTASPSGVRSFVYSQRHILGVIVPDLLEKRDKLLLDGDSASVQMVADQTQKQQYLSTVAVDDPKYGLDGGYQLISPSNKEQSTDEVANYNNMITQWMKLIASNETEKVTAIAGNSPFKQYSVADATISYSESCSGSQGEKFYPTLTYFNFNKTSFTNMGFSSAQIGQLTSKIVSVLTAMKTGEKQTINYEDDAFGYAGKANEGTTLLGGGNFVLSMEVAGNKTSFSFLPNVSFNVNDASNFSKVNNRTISYNLSMADNSYLDVDVYRAAARDKVVKVDSWVATTDVGSLNGYDNKGIFRNEQPADFIYYVRGGGTRHPYIGEEQSMIYSSPTGDFFTLGQATAKIDNPRIYIKNPVVNNQPQDEKAVFEVVLTNESELPDGVTNLKPSAFSLLMDDESNPHGAKISMDGPAITSGRTFYISPKQSITKTFEVQRGVGYDFENLKMQLADESFSLVDEASFSVHYLPTSSPVNLSLPTENWVMNTLSPKDTTGYYLPVQIDGYNLEYENFDHIELQYKKQTESNDQWVNLCSFYADQSLYDAATGEKQMIDRGAGKITSINFYGEKDPMEMKYDLRAVTFCRLGTGYVTRSSKVVSGTKDTRIPQVFGIPSPSSGILTYEDVLKIDFNEPIAYNYLDETANFQVMGYTNHTSLTTGTSLHFPGQPTQDAATSVERNLYCRDFSVDMMVKTDKKGTENVFFSHGTKGNSMAFGVTKDDRLFARYNADTVYSDKLPVSLSSGLTHVGMMHKHTNSGQVVTFFFNNTTNGSITMSDNSYGQSGLIHLGVDIKDPNVAPLKGNLLEVRLWDKVLSDDDIAQHNQKRLTGYEQNLIASWPLNDSQGTIAKDQSKGANLTLKGTSWNNVSGYSLRTDQRPVCLNGSLMTASSNHDNSLTFWFRVEDLTAQRSALFKAGDDNLDPTKAPGKLFIGFQGDSLVLETLGNTYMLGSRKSMANQQWHHFAMTVNRSGNVFSAYIDNQLVAQDDATNVGGIASDHVALGDNGMVANFDKLSRWMLALPKTYIEEFHNTMLTGSEMGLSVYLPFSYRANSSMGIKEDVFTPYNEVKNADGKVVRSDKTKVIIDDLTDANMDNKQHAPLRETGDLDNYRPVWTSTDNALQIDLQTQLKNINKQYIYITVRGVEDLNGNSMASPYMWSCFVDKNVLRWDNRNTVKAEVAYGQSLNVSLPFSNMSGKVLNYQIYKTASWLTIDREQGTLGAEQQNEMTVTVDAGLTPGVYTETFYLVDEDELIDAVTLEVTVSGSEPQWNVDMAHFDRTMNLIAEVKVKQGNGDYVIDDNTDDKVAAFVEGTCVGVANISRTQNGNAYLYMTIYGNELTAKTHSYINFLLWNKRTGQTCVLERYNPNAASDDDNYVLFQTNTTYGCPPEEPIELRTTDLVEQTLALNEGWNWVSFNVAPQPVAGINTIFLDPNHLVSDGDIIKHVDYVQYSEKYQSWLGTLSHGDYRNVYQVYVTRGGEYKVLGSKLTGDQLTVKVNGGGQTGVWNELPYLLQYSKPIEQALADFQIGHKAMNGDVIKSLDEFAVASESKGGWIGSLRYMRPGQGYYLYHQGDSTEFSYQDDNVTTRSVARVARRTITSEGNMPVIATFASDVVVEEGDRLTAYVGGKMVGTAQRTELEDGRAVFFLSVNAEAGDVVTFAQERDGEVVARTRAKVGYNSNSVVGTIDLPYEVSFTSTDTSTGYYDLHGRRLPDGYKPQQQGIYIKDGKKKVFR